tara:strand:+ start:65 stop:196 length:132 start_codon:yes stop_codon:yes gene_type:complete
LKFKTINKVPAIDKNRSGKNGPVTRLGGSSTIKKIDILYRYLL